MTENRAPYVGENDPPAPITAFVDTILAEAGNQPR